MVQSASSAGAPGRVVGEQARHPEPAHEVERGLHRLTYPRAGLVRAEQLDGEPVHLAAEPRLHRDQRGPQRRVGPGGDPDLDAAENSGPVNSEASSRIVASTRSPSGGSAAASARSSALRRSARCSTAAMSSADLVR